MGNYFEQLKVAVEEIGRLRWIVGQVIMLAAEASNLTDHELRDALAANATLDHRTNIN
jgi:hypothetical protein